MNIEIKGNMRVETEPISKIFKKVHGARVNKTISYQQEDLVIIIYDEIILI